MMGTAQHGSLRRYTDPRRPKSSSLSHIFYIWLCLVGFDHASEAGIGQRQPRAEQQGGTRMAMRDELINFILETEYTVRPYCRDKLRDRNSKSEYLSRCMPACMRVSKDTPLGYENGFLRGSPYIRT